MWRADINNIKLFTGQHLRYVVIYFENPVLPGGLYGELFIFITDGLNNNNSLQFEESWDMSYTRNSATADYIYSKICWHNIF